MTISRYTADVEFHLPLGLLKAEGHDLQGANHLVVEVDDEEAIVTQGDLGVLVCTGVLSQTYTYAMRDAVCVAQSVIMGLLGIGRTEEVPPVIRVGVVHQDSFLAAAIDTNLINNERSTA